jgi:hypothetical protein
MKVEARELLCPVEVIFDGLPETFLSWTETSPTTMAFETADGRQIRLAKRQKVELMPRPTGLESTVRSLT